jgi:hypothetical protein
MSALNLGPIGFDSFELPGRIRFGGRQRLAIHALPGGARVVDAMGRDDAPLSWAGVFSGPDATSRAVTLDLLRAQGAELSLAWDVFSYVVVVSEFTASYQRQNWIPYRIVCTVVFDTTFQAIAIATPLLQTLLGDVAAAGTFGVDMSAPTAALGVTDALTVGTGSYSGAGVALGAVSATIATSLASAGTALTAAATFPAAAAAAQQCAQFAAAQGYVQRAQTNLANAGS